MYELAPAYLVELARQTAFLSAFLGGFAGIMLQMLLPTPGRGRLVATAAGCAATAGTAFIVALTASTMITAVLHPDAPAYVADSGGVATARIVSAGMFLLGLYALLASLGLSGWIRSKTTGLTTSICAGVGAAFVTWAMFGF